MDHAVLVDLDVAAGRKIVLALEDHGIDFEVAILATFTDYYSPRLVFAAKWLEEYDPLAMYMEFGNRLREAGGEQFSPQLKLMKLSDPFIIDLRETLGVLRDSAGYRLDGQSFGGRYLEDGFVYRVK